jgi:hypothetical protein
MVDSTFTNLIEFSFATVQSFHELHLQFWATKQGHKEEGQLRNNDELKLLSL